jgi:hypothetical protein
MMELNYNDSKVEKGIQVTLVVALRAFVDRSSMPFGMMVDRRQEYLPHLRRCAEARFGIDTGIDSSAQCARNEMMFERVAPSCYLREPFSVLLEQGAPASEALGEMPAKDMHRAVPRISQVDAEICETAEHTDAGSSRKLGHGNKADGNKAGGKKAAGKIAAGKIAAGKIADGKIADGMSAGG